VKRQAVEVETIHERASATPEGKRLVPAVAPRSAPSPARTDDGDTSLRGRQRRFAAAVMTPESLPAPFGDGDAARWLTAGPRLSAVERLDIYRHAYHARLVECLADDYPVTQHALGEAAFDELCRGYVALFPSTGPSLNFFGRRMSEFVRDGATQPIQDRGFVADLTALEWAIVEVIHAASEPPLTAEGLRDVPAEAWGDVRLQANTALRLLRFAHPVNEYLQAFREDRSPAIPAPAASATVVYRSGPTVWRMDLTEPMVVVLSSLVAGDPLGSALSRAEASLAGVPEAEVVARVTTWFREWVGHGLFVGARWL
jgi:Putative DNA-binding domain